MAIILILMSIIGAALVFLALVLAGPLSVAPAFFGGALLGSGFVLAITKDY